uniref:Uncharacterized protein n=1 Tax=Leersia perrieri TaxID=77586 RepID=A0A0D9W8U7_9ORYZ
MLDSSNATVSLNELNLGKKFRNQLRYQLPNTEASIDIPHLGSGELSLQLMANAPFHRLLC